MRTSSVATGVAFPKPMLARWAARIPHPEQYAYELKWDGYRILAWVERSRLELQTRSGLSALRQYPELAKLQEHVGKHALMLDGEVVVLDERGIPRFHLLQQHLSSSGRNAQLSVVYMIFDLLFENGQPLLNVPYFERRERLEALNLNGKYWHTPAFLRGSPRDILIAANAQGLEGLVAKRLDSLYLPGQRTDAWVKLKIRKRQEFVICGWQPGQGSRAGLPGALLLGYYDTRPGERARKLVYAGECGSGFSDESLRILKRLLEKHRTAVNPFDMNAPTAREAKKLNFAHPRLVGEFEFTEWTPTGALRHAVFLGLRNDRRPTDVVREEA